VSLDWENWLAVSARDIRVAVVLIDEGIFDAAAFHAHQAAESALKAVWLHTARTLAPKSHQLLDLAGMVEAPPSVVAACRRLNPHYAGSRYPDAANGDPAANYDRELATELLEASERVCRWCSEQLR
jgi:HEPN domain-containing protein